MGLRSNRRVLLFGGGIFLFFAFLCYLRISQSDAAVEDLREELENLRKLKEHVPAVSMDFPTPPPHTESEKAQRIISRVIQSNRPKMHLPTIAHIYPHLSSIADWNDLNPELVYPSYSSPSNDVKLVIGVPAVSRGNTSYLMGTVEMLIRRISVGDVNSMRVVIMLSHEQGAASPFVLLTLEKLKLSFSQWFDSGFLQVIVPPAAWYPPDMSSIPPTFDDTPERMYWRTKQNLDYVYLMLFASALGENYMQIEDDVEIANGYSTSIFKAMTDPALQPWSMLEFSSLGCIGKLTRSVDVSAMAVYVLLNYRFKPIDWIFNDFYVDKYCSPEMTGKKCTKAIRTAKKQVKPSLFQHIGTFSSLKGKIQKLKDKSFRPGTDLSKMNLSGGATAHEGAMSVNPPATIKSSFTEYQKFTVEGMYEGRWMAWLMDPKEGDFIEITFNNPAAITSISIETALSEHPDDILDETASVFIRYTGDSTNTLLGTFDSAGTFKTTTISEKTSDMVRIELKATPTHWILIRQLTLDIKP